MLQETEVDGHRVFLGFRHIRHTRKESLRIQESIVGDTLAEVHIERRIAHHIVEHLFHLAILQVPPVCQRVTLYHVRQRVYQIIQYQVKPQHRGTLLTLVLRIDGATIHTYLMCQGNNQRTSSRCRVTSRYAFQLFMVIHQQARHDGSHSVRRIILRILTATILVIV